MPAYDIPSDRKEVITSYSVKYKDIFNMDELYKAVHDWLADYDYKDQEDRSDHYEILYFERDSGGVKEHWMLWRPNKIPGESSYYKFHLDIDWHTLALKGTEVTKGGKKFSAHKGEVEISVKAILEKDRHELFKHKPIMKLVGRWYPKSPLYKDIYDQHIVMLYRDAYLLQNFIKKWFHMKSYLPYEEESTFHPPESFPSHIK